MENEELHLSLASSKFDAERGPATREIALLIAAGRQAGGWDADWTSTKLIRQICEDMGKLDGANFATAIRRMDEVFGFSGSGRGLKVKVNRKGQEDAAALMLRLTGAEAA